MHRAWFSALLLAAWAGCNSGTDVECGSGTVEDDGVCIGDPPGPDAGGDGLECGPGTHEESGLCVPNMTGDPLYEVRVGTSEIPADGYSKIPVLVIGRDANGDPATDQVVLNTSRAGAGTFDPPAPTLGPLGATSLYTPCSSATPGCAGPVELTLALASAPSEVVATSGELLLVEPEGVGSTAPCDIGGNVLFFDGEMDWIFTGTQTVTAGSWSGSINIAGDFVSISVTPADSALGLWWDARFSTQELGLAMMQQVYEDAERYPFEAPGHPGLSISGDGRGCNTLTGRFQIHQLDVTGTTLNAFTATFEQNCEGGPGVLRGCVHFE